MLVIESVQPITITLLTHQLSHTVVLHSIVMIDNLFQVYNNYFPVIESFLKNLVQV
jgi:hypothetical protein